ncbi:hypothetical protein BSK66_24845 [Paenibacillus odorifer]|uniref:hypothetical protein n=1 Tax=Paenibacillus TaxID=44249 RepID=UPI0003E1CA44|nr:MULTISPECIES: hypothetical protein [Paenibacillus]ETT54823.1 hypothetical protein C171_20184 [Paenibacillus sp. FSL H8-237]OME50696.1 hypothetical protein BSK66_24845 [Paenibacillus odorifer]SIR49856.1 hypothetical protein SAMN05880555_3993 [Paenibacillus sp. RU4X]SIR58845.1 hypothetical protein SAMN05880570_3996 [Paenibacillus sp. RU4T]
MKWIEWAIVGALIFLPFAIVNRNETDTLRQTVLTEMKYNAALDAAVDDAASVLVVNANQQQEAQYGSVKRVALNKEEAMSAFYRTLDAGFGITDPVTQGVLHRYIPAIVVIGYDGFYVYSEEEWAGADGKSVMKPVWGAKKPYAYADSSGNSLSFTLDQQVLAYDAASRSWHEGLRQDIRQKTTIPLLQDAALFEQIRRSTIVRAIQDELAYRINRYNETVSRNGLSYTFTLPLISNEDWNNTVDDVGVLAFVQGIPMGAKVYNSYALGGSRILKRPTIIGAKKGSMKVYFRSSCGYSYPAEETFASEQAAARKGYMPLSCP